MRLLILLFLASSSFGYMPSFIYENFTKHWVLMDWHSSEIGGDCNKGSKTYFIKSMQSKQFLDLKAGCQYTINTFNGYLVQNQFLYFPNYTWPLHATVWLTSHKGDPLYSTVMYY